MSIRTSNRVFSPFKNRVTDASPAQAKILRQVNRVMDFYIKSGSERSRLHQREWKRKSKYSVIGELEMLDNTIAGVASWCEGSRKHPDPMGAIRQMMHYDIATLSKQLDGFPQLQACVTAIAKLRGQVIDFLEQQIPPVVLPKKPIKPLKRITTAMILRGIRTGRA